MHLTKAWRQCIAAFSFLLFLIPNASAQGLIRDTEIESLLREYGTPLFEAGGFEPETIDLYIVSNNSLNAFVTSGQNMFLHTGLLTKAKNPEEILGVMAHETGHLTSGHNITRLQAARSAQGATWIALGLGVLAAALGAPDAGAVLAASSPYAGTTTFFKYTRIEESSADQAGLSLLEETGMPADGLVSFMDQLRNNEVLSLNIQTPYYRTHPELGPRMAAMRERAQAITAKSNPLPEDWYTGLEMAQAKLIGFLQPRSVIGKYPATDTSPAARYARSIAAHQLQDQTTALKEIDSLIAESPDNPYFHELRGQILFENSRFEDSVAPHRRALELKNDHSLLYVNLARSLLALKTDEAAIEAEELLHRAILLEPSNAYAWTQMSFALGALDRKAEAELATAEAAYAIGNVAKANVFANRAKQGLDSNSVKWQRADDIVASSTYYMRQMR